MIISPCRPASLALVLAPPLSLTTLSLLSLSPLSLSLSSLSLSTLSLYSLSLTTLCSDCVLYSLVSIVPLLNTCEYTIYEPI